MLAILSLAAKLGVVVGVIVLNLANMTSLTLSTGHEYEFGMQKDMLLAGCVLVGLSLSINFIVGQTL